MPARFTATKESEAHIEYKNALTQAKENDTVFTICFDKGWPTAAQHRVLRNDTFNMWDAAGSPPLGQRPGEHDIVCNKQDGSGVERYSTEFPFQGYTGKVTDLAMYAGQGVKNIKDIPSTSDLLIRIWKELRSK